jgi:glutamate-ammonia-ligase adenylyltransferase
MTIQSDPEDALERAKRLSRYVRNLVDSGACTISADDLEAPFSRSLMREALASPVADEAQLMNKLRKLRQQVMIRIITRDLNNRADLKEVVDTVTALAEETLQTTVEFYEASLRAIYGDPRNASGEIQTLHIIAMGKLGGGELNVSSDIDLIFAYPDDGQTDGKRVIDNHDYFTRLSRSLIGAMAEFTEDGFVFRVDTRLRPYGDSGPLVVSFDMLEEYFYTQGREWERYAWVKARAITGDHHEQLQSFASPFVYRRHLDYSALESLRNLHSQIRQEVSRRNAGDDIKLGPGGIREIEFLVQVFQLVRGGKEHALRERSTLGALDQLEKRGLVEKPAVEKLRNAYVFLRNLEHRIQYLDDQQTQKLPESTGDLKLIAEGMGFAGIDTFSAALKNHRDTVQEHFEAIFSESEESAPGPCTGIWLGTLSDEEAVSALTALGFRESETTRERLSRHRDSARVKRMAASGQARLERLMPMVIEGASGESNPDVTLQRMLGIIDAIGRRESYLALLIEYPQALAAVARLASASPWAAEYLARHPVLLDELIAPQKEELPDWARLQGDLHGEMETCSDNPEQQMDLLRNFKHAQTFRLLALDLAGRIELETLSDQLSDLASLLLDETLCYTWRAVRTRHRDTPRFCIVGYGKLGGKELGYASDLDIVFLYDDDDDDAGENYARLAQRINNWLNSTTAAGVLYETDLRLRPNGAAGLLISSIEAFRDYQYREAWVWEHQALTRARAVSGDRRIGSEFERIRIEVMCQKRDPAALRVEVEGMRRKMRDGHPNASDLFDLKHDPGGIVDVEFVVQYLVLAYAAQHPGLTDNIGNLALLNVAAELGLIPKDLASRANDAYRVFRARQHALRLRGESYARLPRSDVSVEVESVRELWAWVFEEKRV